MNLPHQTHFNNIAQFQDTTTWMPLKGVKKYKLLIIDVYNHKSIIISSIKDLNLNFFIFILELYKNKKKVTFVSNSK